MVDLGIKVKARTGELRRVEVKFRAFLQNCLEVRRGAGSQKQGLGTQGSQGRAGLEVGFVTCLLQAGLGVLR